MGMMKQSRVITQWQQQLVWSIWRWTKTESIWSPSATHTFYIKNTQINLRDVIKSSFRTEPLLVLISVFANFNVGCCCFSSVWSNANISVKILREPIQQRLHIITDGVDKRSL